MSSWFLGIICSYSLFCHVTLDQRSFSLIYLFCLIQKSVSDGITGIKGKYLESSVYLFILPDSSAFESST